MEYLVKILLRIDKRLLITLQNSLEGVLKSNYFLQEENRNKAVMIAEFLYEYLDDEQMNPFIFQEFLGFVSPMDKILNSGPGGALDKRKSLR